MKNTKELNSLKKELNNFTLLLKQLNKNNEELKKIILKQDQFIQKKKAQRRISYIDWLSNERRINNLIPD
ncbi:MAG: hypothetical protein IPL53_03570 [Ignavibacteria bacterium]|nr:hypothetical protein [Ignavibacteria bacterium]